MILIAFDLKLKQYWWKKKTRHRQFFFDSAASVIIIGSDCTVGQEQDRKVIGW